ncbi:MAG: cyanophycin synthetase [Thermoplasmatota archaeon]
MSGQYIRISSLNHLKGANVHALFPVLKVTLDIENVKNKPVNTEIKEKLFNLLPILKTQGGTSNEFLKGQKSSPSQIIIYTALAVQNMAGDVVSFGKVLSYSEYTSELVLEYDHEKLVDYAIEKAVDLYNKIADGERDLDGYVNSIIKKAQNIYARRKMGPSTKAILDAAKKHDIPFKHIQKDYSLYSLGWGVKKKRIWGPVTSETPMISSDIAQNKLLTKKILYETGFSVPRGEIVTSKEEAVKSAVKLSYPVIIKPLDGHHGEGVLGDIRSKKEAEEAFEIAKDYSDKLLLEEYIPGEDYRFLVIDNEVKAVARRIPAHVIGDGKSTIKELVEMENEDPRRGEGHQSVLTNLRLGKEEVRFLKTRGFIPESVPDKGEKIFLRVGGNLSTGGISEDYTERIHPELKKIIERASKVIGMDLAGIDIVAEDVTSHPDDMRWGIIEANASPGLRMHTNPTLGNPINVGEDIIDHLYPNKDGRIPLVAVTGTNGKTTTSRLIEWVARGRGFKTGMAVTGGIHLDGDKVVDGDTTGPWSARVVLDNPEVEYAVLETSRGGIVKKGLGFDKPSVSVVTNIREDHLGMDGLETLDDIFEVKSVLLKVTREDGYCVFNGNDDYAEQLLQRCNGTPIVFALERDKTVESFIQEGITTFLVEGESIVMIESGDKEYLAKIADIPYLMGGAKMMLENTLAAIAASHVSGLSKEVIIDNLKTFSMDEEKNPGRLNIFELEKSLVVLDYAHNIDGIKALGDYVGYLPGGRKVIAFTIPGDRSDNFIKKCGKKAAELFDMVVCTENQEITRGRGSGEICNLVAQGALENGGNVPINISDKMEAVKFVLENKNPGDKLVLADLDITSKDLTKILSENGLKGHLKTFNREN